MGVHEREIAPIFGTRLPEMPASKKMLKRRELSARAAAGIGDSKGRLPHKEIRVAVMVRLTVSQ